MCFTPLNIFPDEYTSGCYWLVEEGFYLYGTIESEWLSYKSQICGFNGAIFGSRLRRFGIRAIVCGHFLFDALELRFCVTSLLVGKSY